MGATFSGQGQVGSYYTSDSGTELVCISRSFSIGQMVKDLLRDIDGIVGVRMLEGDHPKVFVVTDGLNVQRDFRIVERLVRVEDAFASTTLNYDVVPASAAQLIPAAARDVRV